MNVVSPHSVSRTKKSGAIRIRTTNRYAVADVIGNNQIVGSVNIHAALYGVRHAVPTHSAVADRGREEDPRRRCVMDVVIGNLVVAARQINTGTVTAVIRVGPRAYDLKAIHFDVIGLNIEPLHLDRPLRLENDQVAGRSGAGHVDAFIICAALYDHGAAGIHGIRRLLDRFPGRSQNSGIDIVACGGHVESRARRWRWISGRGRWRR